MTHAYLVKQATRKRRAIRVGDRLFAHLADGRLHERADIRSATRFRNAAHAEAARTGDEWMVWAPTTTLGADA